MGYNYTQNNNGDIYKTPIKIIGISGVARSGKNTFGNIAQDIFIKNGYEPIQVAFADLLKNEVDHMLTNNNFNLSAYTSDSKQKENIRPLLVWWGMARRLTSNGSYWIDKVDKYILGTLQNWHAKGYSDNIVFINTDCRFSNEVDYIHSRGGKIIHIKKYEMREASQMEPGLSNKCYIQPPNDEERKNDPIVQKMADQKFEWEHINESDPEILKNNSYLQDLVINALNETKYFNGESKLKLDY